MAQAFILLISVPKHIVAVADVVGLLDKELLVNPNVDSLIATLYVRGIYHKFGAEKFYILKCWDIASTEDADLSIFQPIGVGFEPVVLGDFSDADNEHFEICVIVFHFT